MEYQIAAKEEAESFDRGECSICGGPLEMVDFCVKKGVQTWECRSCGLQAFFVALPRGSGYGKKNKAGKRYQRSRPILTLPSHGKKDENHTV